MKISIYIYKHWCSQVMLYLVAFDQTRSTGASELRQAPVKDCETNLFWCLEVSRIIVKLPYCSSSATVPLCWWQTNVLGCKTFFLLVAQKLPFAFVPCTKRNTKSQEKWTCCRLVFILHSKELTCQRNRHLVAGAAGTMHHVWIPLGPQFKKLSQAMKLRFAATEVGGSHQKVPPAFHSSPMAVTHSGGCAAIAMCSVLCILTPHMAHRVNVRLWCFGCLQRQVWKHTKAKVREPLFFSSFSSRLRHKSQRHQSPGMDEPSESWSFLISSHRGCCRIASAFWRIQPWAQRCWPLSPWTPRHVWLMLLTSHLIWLNWVDKIGQSLKENSIEFALLQWPG